MTSRNYYQVLGVTRDAAAGEIRAAYARLVRRHHPDRVGDLPTRLADIQQAYRCLADPRARAAHDRMIAEAERLHAAQRRRVQHRLRRYDRRHPRPIAGGNWRRFAVAAVAMAGVVGVSLRLLG